MRTATLLILAMLAAAAAPAAAQQTADPGAQQTTEPAAQPPAEPGAQPVVPAQPEAAPPSARHTTLIWTEELEGKEIRTPQGEELGEINGVLLDQAQARVSYVMVEIGGFLGIGGRMVAVPWGALQPSADGKYYTMNVTEEVLQAAPSAEQNSFEEVADVNWQQSVEAYWNQRAGLVPR